MLDVNTLVVHNRDALDNFDGPAVQWQALLPPGLPALSPNGAGGGLQVDAAELTNPGKPPT